MAQTKKIVILGHFGVGKTSLIRRYVDSAFSEDYLVTVGVHVKKREIDLHGEKVTLIIWDVEGNTSIDKARKSYLLGSHGFLYVFDVSRQETYEHLAEEKEYLAEHYSNIPVSIIGNKNDLLVDDANKAFFESDRFEGCRFTSAKTGEHVEDVFLELTKAMVGQ